MVTLARVRVVLDQLIVRHLLLRKILIDPRPLLRILVHPCTYCLVLETHLS